VDITDGPGVEGTDACADAEVGVDGLAMVVDELSMADGRLSVVVGMVVSGL